MVNELPKLCQSQLIGGGVQKCVAVHGNHLCAHLHSGGTWRNCPFGGGGRPYDNYYSGPGTGMVLVIAIVSMVSLSAGISQWLLKSEKGIFHPIWDRWGLSVVHLRNIPGVKPPVLQFPGATHELVIVSLDPEADPIDPDQVEPGLPWMQPVEVTQQFTVPKDTHALMLLEGVVESIVEGYSSPDRDYRRLWEEAILKSADNLCGEHSTGHDHNH